MGPKNAETLSQLGLTTVGDVANWSEAALTARLGKLGADIWRRAQGIDFRPVMTEHEAKSISKELTFARDVADEAALKLTLRRLSDGVGRQARKAGLAGTTVKIKLRWTDFTTLNRQVTLDQPTDMDSEIFALAARLFDQVWVEGRPVRLIGVGLGGFSQPNKQMGLWEDRAGEEQAEELQSALDRLRDRFGETMITRASDLNYRPNEDNKR